MLLLNSYAQSTRWAFLWAIVMKLTINTSITVQGGSMVDFLSAIYAIVK